MSNPTQKSSGPSPATEQHPNYTAGFRDAARAEKARARAIFNAAMAEGASPDLFMEVAFNSGVPTDEAIKLVSFKSAAPPKEGAAARGLSAAVKERVDRQSGRKP